MQGSWRGIFAPLPHLPETLTTVAHLVGRHPEKRSRGPATLAGRACIRDAHIRHGFYVQKRDQIVALRVLGEDPAKFEELRQRVYATWRPADDWQAVRVERLARATWRLQRLDCQQEGFALRQAREVTANRHARFAGKLVSLRIIWAGLQTLAAKVAEKHYATTDEDLKLMQNLCETELGDAGRVPLGLLLQLAPAEATNSTPLTPSPQEIEKLQRSVRTKVRSLFGLPPDAKCFPQASEEKSEEVEGAEPQPSKPKEVPQGAQVRQQLAFLLERLATHYGARCQVCFVDELEGPSLCERAAEIAPTHAHAALMLRMEEANFRQLCRLTHLLLKMQRRESARNMPVFGKAPKRAAGSYDVNENKES